MQRAHLQDAEEGPPPLPLENTFIRVHSKTENISIC